jgi:membrane-bound lytic murein transglycosylase F
MKSGRLSVLTESSSVGFSVKSEGVLGFQYEIVKAFADSLGLELLISEQNDMKVCVTGLESGDYNLIANFVPTTTEWNEKLLFTLPILSSRQVLVQLAANDSDITKTISSVLELANDTIYIPINSVYKMRLQNLSNEIAEKIVVLEMNDVSSEQMVRLVAKGIIKQTICEEQLARKMKLQYPEIDISLPIGFSQNLAWAVHPHSPLLQERLNAFLSDFIGSSAYWELYRKYYN